MTAMQEPHQAEGALQRVLAVMIKCIDGKVSWVVPAKKLTGPFECLPNQSMITFRVELPVNGCRFRFDGTGAFGVHRTEHRFTFSQRFPICTVFRSRLNMGAGKRFAFPTRLS